MLLRDGKSPSRIDMDKGYIGMCHREGLKVGLYHFAWSTGFRGEKGDCKFRCSDDGVEFIHSRWHFNVVVRVFHR